MLLVARLTFCARHLRSHNYLVSRRLLWTVLLCCTTLSGIQEAWPAPDSCILVACWTAPATVYIQPHQLSHTRASTAPDRDLRHPRMWCWRARRSIHLPLKHRAIPRRATPNRQPRSFCTRMSLLSCRLGRSSEFHPAARFEQRHPPESLPPALASTSSRSLAAISPSLTQGIPHDQLQSTSSAVITLA
jgi:hypothetical protein